MTSEELRAKRQEAENLEPTSDFELPVKCVAINFAQIQRLCKSQTQG